MKQKVHGEYFYVYQSVVVVLRKNAYKMVCFKI